MRLKNTIGTNLFSLLCIFALALATMTSAWAAKGGGKGKPGDGSGSNSGEDIKLVCVFYEGEGRNVLDDNRDPPEYFDGDRGVTCSTGGTSQPNLSGIKLDPSTGGGGQERQVDLALELCDEDTGNCNNYLDYKAYWLTDTGRTELLYALTPGMKGLFTAGTGGYGDSPEALNLDMENLRFNVRPYDTQDHIQKLGPGTYGMAVTFALKRAEQDAPRVAISLASKDIAGDQFQGIACEAPDTVNALTADVPVTVHPSSDDPLLYTVETNGYQLAAICSNIPEGVCGRGAKASDLCTFHGLVKVKFKMDAFAAQ